MNEMLSATDLQREDGRSEEREDLGTAISSKAIVVAATFTADLLQKPLEFWMQQLQIAAQVTIAPYAQVMQELLNPQSLFGRNPEGFNVLLVRLDDWTRDRQDESAEANVAHLRRASSELVDAVRSFRGRSAAPLLIFLCPARSGLPEIDAQTIAEIQHDLFNQLTAIPYTHCWTHSELALLYPVGDYEDARTDRL
jgi:hypothetical protein